jgi:hypothetical protein
MPENSGAKLHRYEKIDFLGEGQVILSNVKIIKLLLVYDSCLFVIMYSLLLSTKLKTLMMTIKLLLLKKYDTVYYITIYAE